MLDRKFIVENVELVKTNCAQRGVYPDIDRLVEIETRRRDKLQEVQELNRRANEVSKSIGSAKDSAERERRKEEGRCLRAEKDAAQVEHDQLEAQILALQTTRSQPFSSRSTVGADETANRERGGGNRHLGVSTSVPVITSPWGNNSTCSTWRGGPYDRTRILFPSQRSRSAGTRPAAIRHPETDRSWVHPHHHSRPGPDRILDGIGFMPRGPETQVYSIENSDFSLVGTAEMTLGGLFAEQLSIRAVAGEVVRPKSLLPNRSGSTRPSDSRHLSSSPVHQDRDVRVHAPDQATLCTGTSASSSARSLTSWRFLTALWTPPRGIWVGRPTGNSIWRLGCQAVATVGEWGEITSTSNCTDYQVRRLNVRYKRKGEKGTHLVHTLNGTAVAATRAIHRHPGKPPATGRQRRHSGGAAALGRKRPHRAEERVS